MDKKMLVSNYNAFLKREKLEPTEVIVGAGGALLMHGLRKETNDIDVGVTKKVFDTFNHLPSHLFGTTLVLECQDLLIDIHEHDDMSGVLIDGVYVYTLERLLKFKLKLNRPKDQKDIKALKKALKK